MDKLIEYGPDLLQSGVFKDLQNTSAPLWVDGVNMYSSTRGIASMLGAQLITGTNYTQKITGLAQSYLDGAPILYIGCETFAYRKKREDSSPALLMATGLGSTKRTRIIPWGRWAIINNGANAPKLYKETGLALDLKNIPFSTVQHLITFKNHLMAANTSNSPSNLEWSSLDDVETWAAGDPSNSAGNLTLRDLDGPIRGIFNLGDTLAAYSDNNLILVSFLGNTFVFGAIPTLTGVGAWGGEAVCDLLGMNFGFGPQGLFSTNGHSFDYLGKDRTRDFVKANLDQARREEAFVWHNLEMEVIEFCFWGINGKLIRLGYSYSRREFWVFDKEISHAISRQSFSSAIGSSGNSIFYLNKGNDWLGQSIAGFVQSKSDAFGDETHAKLINFLSATGNISGLTLEVTAQENETDILDPMYTAPLANNNWFNAEGLLFRFKLSFTTALSPILLTNIAVYGKVCGSI